ncbi:hypothetical protein PPSIR1_31193 [Plesiocystis pacifica SIR-1]|uniref:eCIS core domain-containing protein n=1 Tax=Plesiocystis pacifica SIR-1 TaxID=391625 RepID=A6GHP0_9BACT|nr:DUF4157 domain-containing protein [Plesiocystis pacifica]EDM74620.1 hypothetical protein PPSIR1_31193 [Plesiocystis pacifica SIR-1]
MHDRVETSRESSRARAVEAPAASELAPEGELQALANASPRVRGLRRVQAMADGSSQVEGASANQSRADRAQAVHHAAGAGLRGSSRALPYLSAIQASFGRHDLSGVQAHLGAQDSSARAGAEAMGAQAYATGEHVVFRDRPSLFMAAHEAAHVVQQRGGVQLFGGVGEAGDVHERHADEVAGLVVRGESAEAALDRYADPSRPLRGSAGVQRAVQCWGEPDHYAMGQLAGIKAVGVIELNSLDLKEEEKDTDYLGSKEEDKSRKHTVHPMSGTLDVRTDYDHEDKFVVRDLSGKSMSYGAANRFAGDLSGRPIEDFEYEPVGSTISSLGGHYTIPGLMSWPGKLDEHDTDYAPLSGYKEKTLMLTNANHFYPLAGAEYRRQHAHAKQTMAMAVMLRANPKSHSDVQMAKNLSRMALMYEAFAGHFLADCFAAGHLAPHAIGLIGLKTRIDKGRMGAQVNTWHDILNAVPDGVPTTLGRFHGDYSMDAGDLEYVSTVLANSLLEIAMPWYARKSYDPKIVLPAPDLPAIMADPVVGPLWAQMTKDYSKRMKLLAKHSSSDEYAFRTDTTELMTGDEAIGPILQNVFGGRTKGAKQPSFSRTKRPAIIGKVYKIVEALYQMLAYRGGWQTESGLSKEFKTMTEEERSKLPYKFRVDLQSDNPLKMVSPATPPLFTLLEDLSWWRDRWKESVSTSKVEPSTTEKMLLSLTDRSIEAANKLAAARAIKDKEERGREKAVSREHGLKMFKVTVEEFARGKVPMTLPPKIAKVQQGTATLSTNPDVPLTPPPMGYDSGRVVGDTAKAVTYMTTYKTAALPAYRQLGVMLDAFAMDPWHRNEKLRAVQFGLLEQANTAFYKALGKTTTSELHGWSRGLAKRIKSWSLRKPKGFEKARRTLLVELATYLAEPVKCIDTIGSGKPLLYEFHNEKLARVTGRIVDTPEYVEPEIETPITTMDTMMGTFPTLTEEDTSETISHSTSLMGTEKKKKSWWKR